MARGQNAGYVGSCGTPSPFSSQGGSGFFGVVPSICVSERYDTNVFYRPPAPGLNPADYVTNVTSVLRIDHNGNYASGFLNAGGFGEAYVRNPDLNYLGTNNLLSLNLDNSIKRLLPNASLSVIDTFSYTPLPPGFVNPIAGTSPGAPSNSQNFYAQGIQGFRTNNLMNNGTVSASYAMTASTSLNASYTYAMIRFGSSPSIQTLRLFNSTSQTGTVGGVVQVSELDTLNVRYAHTQSEFTPSSSFSTSPSTSFIINSATIGWSRRLTPNLRAEMGGGGILLDTGLTTYAANAALIVDSLNNSATISYSHTAFPSYLGSAGGGGITIGDIFLLSGIQTIDQRWQLSESAGYAHSTNGTGPNTLIYDSFIGGVDMQYWLTNIWSTTLSYSYTNYTSNSGSVNTHFDRNVITLSVRATWG